jgi:hypothetical protein
MRDLPHPRRKEAQADILESISRLGPCCTTADLVDDTGRTHPSVAKYLRGLARDGAIVRLDQDRKGHDTRGRRPSWWALPSQVPEVGRG